MCVCVSVRLWRVGRSPGGFVGPQVQYSYLYACPYNSISDKALEQPAEGNTQFENHHHKQHNVLDCSTCVLVYFVRSDFASPWTVARLTPLSTGFSRQEYWSGLPFHPPGELPNPGMKPTSHTSPALAGGFFTTCTTWGALCFLSPRLILGVFSDSKKDD